MDFHCLSRKDLQALCKKNKIPANMTNVAMADALQALQLVEGLEEFLNPSESDCQLVNVGMQSVPRTATRTRQKPGKEELGSSKGTITRSRRVTKASISDEIEQENNDANSSMTPAVPTTRRRAPAASARKKIEMGSDDDETNDNNNKINNGFETPGVQRSRRSGTVCKKTEIANEGNSLQKAYSTRRSVRLLEKGIASLSLCHTEQKESTKFDETSVDASDVLKKSNEAEEIKKVRSLNEPAPFNEGCDGIDVASIERKTSDELELKLSDSKLDLGHSDDLEVIECSDESDIPDIKKEVDVSNETEDSDINLISNPTSEQVNVKNSSSDDCDVPGDESDLPVMMVEEKDEMICAMKCPLSEAHPNDPLFSSEKPDSKVESEIAELTEELKDGVVIIASDNQNSLFSSEKPDSKVESEIAELTEESKDGVVTIACDNQNSLSESSLDVQVGSANEDLLENQLPSLFPRPTLSPTTKSVGEKQADGEPESKDTTQEYIICDELEKQVERLVGDKEDDGKAESKMDAVKENMICNKLEKMSMGQLKKMLKKHDTKSKSNTANGDLMVEEKRTALLPVKENRMPVVEVHNKNRDV